jgi:hypothetical protein
MNYVKDDKSVMLAKTCLIVLNFLEASTHWTFLINNAPMNPAPIKTNPHNFQIFTASEKTLEISIRQKTFRTIVNEKSFI